MAMHRQVVRESRKSQQPITHQRSAIRTLVRSPSQHRQREPCEQNAFARKPRRPRIQIQPKRIVEEMDRRSDQRRAQENFERSIASSDLRARRISHERDTTATQLGA